MLMFFATPEAAVAAADDSARSVTGSMNYFEVEAMVQAVLGEVQQERYWYESGALPNWFYHKPGEVKEAEEEGEAGHGNSNSNSSSYSNHNSGANTNTGAAGNSHGDSGGDQKDRRKRGALARESVRASTRKHKLEQRGARKEDNGEGLNMARCWGGKEGQKLERPWWFPD
jgi:hypothetical protein